MSLLAKILGLGEKVVLAYFFGTDACIDALVVAGSVSSAILVLVRELIEPAWIPTLVASVRAGREREAWRLLSRIGLVVGAGLGLAAGCALLSTRDLARALAPGFSEDALRATADLLHFSIPAAVLLGLSSLTYSTLNAYRSFGVPAAGDLAAKGISLLAVLVAGWGSLGVPVLGAGMALGAALRLFVHLWGLRSKLPLLKLHGATDRAAYMQLCGLMAPLVLGVLLSQAGELLDNYFASWLDTGTVSARSYARKIADVPILLVAYSLSVVTFPYLTALAAAGDRERFSKLLGDSLSGVALVFLPLSVALCALAPSIVSVVFERGAFEADAGAATSSALAIYGLATAVFGVEALLVPAFFAQRDTRTPVALGAGTVLLNAALCWFLAPRLGVAGIALAHAAAKTLKTIALGVLAVRRLDSRGTSVLWSAGRMLVATACCGVVAWAWVLATAERAQSASAIERAAHIVSGTGLVYLTFVAAILAQRGPEAVWIRGALEWTKSLAFRPDPRR